MIKIIAFNSSLFIFSVQNMDENNGNEEQITNTTPFVQETDNIESKDVGHVEKKKVVLK